MRNGCASARAALHGQSLKGVVKCHEEMELDRREQDPEAEGEWEQDEDRDEEEWEASDSGPAARASVPTAGKKPPTKEERRVTNSNARTAAPS